MWTCTWIFLSWSWLHRHWMVTKRPSDDHHFRYNTMREICINRTTILITVAGCSINLGLRVQLHLSRGSESEKNFHWGASSIFSRGYNVSKTVSRELLARLSLFSSLQRRGAHHGFHGWNRTVGGGLQLDQQVAWSRLLASSPFWNRLSLQRTIGGQ